MQDSYIAQVKVQSHRRQVKVSVTCSRISDIPISDFASVHDKVKENRKNVLLKQLDSAVSSIEATANTGLNHGLIGSAFCQ